VEGGARAQLREAAKGGARRAISFARGFTRPCCPTQGRLGRQLRALLISTAGRMMAQIATPWPDASRAGF
jgi:hypothetical protein